MNRGISEVPEGSVNWQSLDLSEGFSIDILAHGATATGRLDNKTVLLYREHGELHAFDATCRHLGGPLADGLFVG